MELHEESAPVGHVQVTLVEDDIKLVETNGQVRNDDIMGCEKSPVSMRICR